VMATGVLRSLKNSWLVPGIMGLSIQPCGVPFEFAGNSRLPNRTVSPKSRNSTQRPRKEHRFRAAPHLCAETTCTDTCAPSKAEKASQRLFVADNGHQGAADAPRSRLQTQGLVRNRAVDVDACTAMRHEPMSSMASRRQQQQ
jgi:hypothetical protein